MSIVRCCPRCDGSGRRPQPPVPGTIYTHVDAIPRCLECGGSGLVYALRTCSEAEEPLVTVNGAELTKPQTIALRVALETFASSLRETGLGEDPHGKEMTRLYLQRIAELQELWRS